jgi:mercuric ion transport protein
MSTGTQGIGPPRDAARSGHGEAAGRERRWFGLAAAGSLLGGLGVTACCILPLVLFTLGVGGVWIGRLAALEAYQGVFLALAVISIASGYGFAWRRAAVACGQVVCRPRLGWGMHVAFVVALVLVAAGLAFPYVAPMLLAI